MRDYALVEFYEAGKDWMLTCVDVPFAPRRGELISIREKAWKVRRVTWAVDAADQVTGRTLRACVDLEPVEED